MELFLEFLFTVLVSIVVYVALSKLFCFSTTCDRQRKLEQFVGCESLLGSETNKNESSCGEMGIGCVSQVVDFDETEVSGPVSEFKEESDDKVANFDDKVADFEEDLVGDGVERSGVELVDSGSECGVEANKEDEVIGDCVRGSEESKDEALLVDDDDDWEGIERTELERLFGYAVSFVGSKSNVDKIACLSNTVKLQLYGLHQIVTQGSCHEPQPLALKVSARANWNAWKSLGNMTREDAMEQYVSILSNSIPEFMQDDKSVNSVLVSADPATCSDLHSDSKACQMNIEVPADERIVDT